MYIYLDIKSITSCQYIGLVQLLFAVFLSKVTEKSKLEKNKNKTERHCKKQPKAIQP